jgi:hypothetical protein
MKQQTLLSSPSLADGRCAVGAPILDALTKRWIPMRLSATKITALALLGASLIACGASAPD